LSQGFVKKIPLDSSFSSRAHEASATSEHARHRRMKKAGRSRPRMLRMLLADSYFVPVSILPSASMMS
jgi:hypothetical protein